MTGAGGRIRPNRGTRGGFVRVVGAAAAVAAAALFVWRPGARVAPTGSSGAAAPVGVRVGDLAPEFQVVDIHGRRVTRATLVTGRPGLMFFTATWCLPCVVGLQHLRRFEADAGGQPFNVLVVFVDPTETDDDLRAYRERFTFPDRWHYARDTDTMVLKYRIRYLDTKVALDTRGVIRFVDAFPATYDTWRRAHSAVTGGR
jgi:thiol-disulfide isomerase/thioredoxin